MPLPSASRCCWWPLVVDVMLYPGRAKSLISSHRMEYWGPEIEGCINLRLRNPLTRNPWPRGMVIGVNDHPFELNLLLYIRHAWQLAANADIPALLPPPSPGTSVAPDSAPRTEWESRWQTAWDRSWQWYQNDYNSLQPKDSTPQDLLRWHDTLRQVRHPGQPLNPIAPPLWTSEYGWDGIDIEAFNTWDSTLAARPPIEFAFRLRGRQFSHQRGFCRMLESLTRISVEGSPQTGGLFGPGHSSREIR